MPRNTGASAPPSGGGSGDFNEGDSFSNGRVCEPLPNRMFRVELVNGRSILAHAAKTVRGKLSPGDLVRVERVSQNNPYALHIVAKLSASDGSDP